ncbi:MAG: hypothetical protein EHM54_01065 [Nitrospiraceae bacterium]|nr:MAG: hypothetical protein EHM54_01065 [Nitrospiraceae bacterium]
MRSPILNKTAFLVAYLVLVVMFPCSRGERLQKYHFFQLTETYHIVPLHDIPVVGKASDHDHKHLSLSFYPAKRNPEIALNGVSMPAKAGAVLNAALPPLLISGFMSAFTGLSPPLVRAKTVSGLSPPVRSDVWSKPKRLL